jgi:streptomycin 6-kinase
MRNFELPALVQSRLRLAGADGASWIAGLDGLVESLERDWSIEVGAVLSGGTEALVAEVRQCGGDHAIVKLGIPQTSAFDDEVRALLYADGRGYARVLRHDAERRALLLERLGPRLETLNLPVDAQIEILCATLQRAWVPLPDGALLQTGAAKARWLADVIATGWERLGRPCSERTVEVAVAFAEARQRVFDPAESVLVHGDAHSANLLRSLDGAAFKFVDPDGLYAEPACDLAVPMREWSAPLLTGDALALGQRRAEFIARLTGVPTEPIWQWGFLERVSTGLHALQLGWHAAARDMLSVADRWAQR